MTEIDKVPVNFFDQTAEITTLIRDRKIYLFLDYDGTLTPIVSTPDKAIISDQMREMVRTISQHITTAVVSGRATDDVKGKIALNGNLFYAGSHGFEIIDNQGNVTINDQAQAIRGEIDKVYEELCEELKGVDGALVEHVKYTISTHYRLVSDEDFPKVDAAVNEVLGRHPQLRKTSGKKVFEIRPRIDWDKGKAVNWILDFLDFDPEKDIPIYIGDDTTDEDAFRVIQDKGFGILVAETPRASAAKYMIRDTEDVATVLKFLLEITEQSEK